MHYIGKLDKSIYSCVTKDITTDDVVIAPPIKACQKDEGREEIYQRRKPQEYLCIARLSDAEKFSIWQVLLARFSWGSNITDERIAHIKERHPGDLEQIKPYLNYAIAMPDYILEDENNTGLVLKKIEENGLRMQVVLRIHTSTDNPKYKNSIISAWVISESRWKNYVRNTRKSIFKITSNKSNIFDTK